MELARLIEALSDPAAYPHPAEPVGVRQTHISVVFLAGPFAYKLKKPVNLGFLDFSTLESAAISVKRNSGSTVAWLRRFTSAWCRWRTRPTGCGWKATARSSSGR